MTAANDDAVRPAVRMFQAIHDAVREASPRAGNGDALIDREVLLQALGAYAAEAIAAEPTALRRDWSVSAFADLVARQVADRAGKPNLIVHEIIRTAGSDRPC